MDTIQTKSTLQTACADNTDGAITPQILRNAIVSAATVDPEASTDNTIQPTDPAIIPLIIKGAASQSADLIRCEDSTGATLAKIDSAGNLTAQSFTGTFSGLGTAATHASTDFDASGSATTAQTNAESFATSAITALNLGTAATHAATDFVASTTLGQSSGVATLDGGGHLSTGQIPAALVGAVVYQGTWNATTNSPTITSSTGTKGNYYVVSTGGTTSIDGIAVWNAGDTIIFNGTTWNKIDGTTNEVISFNGRYGVVSPQSGDYTASQITSLSSASINLGGDLSGTTDSATVATIDGSTAVNVHNAELLANAATNANTASTIVKRDASGNFAAGLISPTGLAVTGTTLSPTAAGISTEAVINGSFTPSASGLTADFAGLEINCTINGTSSGKATGLAVCNVTNLLSGGTRLLVDFGNTTGDYHTGYTSQFSVTIGGVTTAAGTITSSGGNIVSTQGSHYCSPSNGQGYFFGNGGTIRSSLVIPSTGSTWVGCMDGTATTMGKFQTGSIARNYVGPKTSSYTTLITDTFVGVDSTSGTVAITVLTANNTKSGHSQVIKDVGGAASTHNISITPATGTIDGGASLTISSNYGSVRIFTDGTNWFSY